jgi:hypothetical protein
MLACFRFFTDWWAPARFFLARRTDSPRPPPCGPLMLASCVFFARTDSGRTARDSRTSAALAWVKAVAGGIGLTIRTRHLSWSSGGIVVSADQGDPACSVVVFATSREKEREIQSGARSDGSPPRSSRATPLLHPWRMGLGAMRVPGSALASFGCTV